MGSGGTLAVFAAAATLYAAREPMADCGTQAGRLQQEIFLHQRHLLSRAKQQTNRAAAAPIINQDVGSIAVMDDSGGVAGRRNPFDLDRKTLVFNPTGAGYGLTLGGDTF